jgi:twinkle protein
MNFSDLGIEERPGTARYTTTCPECSKDRKKNSAPCLSVFNEPGNRGWNCHHCGFKGNLETHEKYEKVKENARLPQNVSQVKSYSKEVSAYLHKRGLTTATCLKEEVYEPTGSKNLIAFPFYISLTIVNVKFHNLSPSKGKPKWFQLPKSLNTSTCFLGLANLEIDKSSNRKKNHVIITEGEWDFLTWKECGYKNVLSVPMGAPSEKAKDFSKEFAYVNEKHFQSIRPYIDTFYLAVDDDGSGKLLRDHLALLLGKERCRIVKYPSGHKDINDVLTHNKELTKDYDKDAVKRCFADASSYPIKGIIRPSDLRYELMQLSDGGLVPGIGTGIGELDYMMTFKRQHISFWTGVPGSGKSTILRWVLVKLIQHNPDLNLKFALFTPENRPVEREVVMISQVLTGKQFKKGQWNSMSDEQRRKSLNFIEKHFFIVAPGSRNYESFGDKVKVEHINTLDSLTHYFSYLAKTEGIFGYVIDAWNKIQHQVGRNMSETSYIEQQLDKLLDFNVYHNCHGFIVAHPTKQELNKRTGRYEIPSLYDIKGSSAWNERADIGVVVHRNIWRPLTTTEQREQDDEDDRNYVARYDAPTIIKTDKIRFEETGNRDMCRFDMEPTGGFRVYEKDKDMHVGKIKKKKQNEEDQRAADEARAQTEIPDFVFKQDDEPLPF